MAQSVGTGVRVFAFDSPEVSPLPELETRKLLADGPFRRRTDTPGKRNFALVLVRVAGTFSQARFDPYVMKDRAKTQEFGDCLAEGLFALLDDRKTLDVAPGISVIRRIQMAEALLAARASLRQITPEHCVAYLAAWHADRKAWREWIVGLPEGLSIEKALLHMGVDQTPS